MLFESHTVISDGCFDLLITLGESLPRRESQLGERWLEWEAGNTPGFQLEGVSGTGSRDLNLERKRGKDRTRRVPETPGGLRPLRAEGSQALEASPLRCLQPVGTL